jgi:hypothetical protein
VFLAIAHSDRPTNIVASEFLVGRKAMNDLQSSEQKKVYRFVILLGVIGTTFGIINLFIRGQLMADGEAQSQFVMALSYVGLALGVFALIGGIVMRLRLSRKWANPRRNAGLSRLEKVSSAPSHPEKVDYRDWAGLRVVTRNLPVALYVAAMIAAVVGVDVLFFRNRFWERLMANIGIVLVFAAFYFSFLKKL